MSGTRRLRKSRSLRLKINCLALGAGLVLAVACSPEPSNTETEGTDGQTKEKLGARRSGPLTTLHRGNVAEPDTLDPHKMSTVYENVIGRDLFCGVSNRKPDGTIFADCAESWDISDDGLTYTFHLREGLKWSDGKPVTSHDYVAGLKRVMDPKTASEQAAILDMVKNARDVSYGRKPLDELGVHAVDELTFVVELERPSPSFIPIYGGPRGSALPRHIYAKYGDDWVKPGNMVSNGPFMLKDWRPHEYVRVEKNPHHYAAANTKLEEIYYYPTDEYNAAVKRFRAGELDLNTQLPTQQVDFLRKILPDAVHIVPSLSVTYIIVNHKKPMFQDLRVRRALSMAIDRTIITEKVMRMGETPAHRFTPYSISDYKGTDVYYSTWPIEKRKEEAIRLLAEAGYGPDNPLAFEYRIRATADGKRHAVAITSMWKDIGVEPEILGTEVKVHYNDLQGANFWIADAGWQALDNPEDFLYLARTEAGIQNYGNYSSERFDDKMNAALQIADIETRHAMMAEAEAIMLDEQGLIPLYFSTNRNLVAPYVKGYDDNAVNAHASQFMWIDLEEPEPQS
jgi:oligopeptide transport system substrate-binding protein